MTSKPLSVACLGGGPAGLYLALLLKKARPDADIEVVERNARGVTFGFGVVFSDETLGYLEENDRPTFEAIRGTFAHWDAIDIHVRGEVIRSGGHGFSGIGRQRLLQILTERCEELGVTLRFGVEVEGTAPWKDRDLVVACDGVRSKLRAQHAGVFQPSLDVRRARYLWLGTSKLFGAFTFLFADTPAGLFQVHAYRFDAATSTFIVECSEETWRKAGLDQLPLEEGVRYLERVFEAQLGGHGLRSNATSWINFVTVKNRAWSDGNVVLLGDAAHTAHFSIGSGTKLAMEDSIALARAVTREPSIPQALAAYEAERRPVVERTQKAAHDSLTWFEESERYFRHEPLQLAASLLTRSKKISYENLKLRDPALGARLTGWFAERAGVATRPPPPPMFTPFRLRGLTLPNRIVVSPMCMYSADEGTVNDFHLVHLGERALGGAGLVITEMTDVSPDGRISEGCAGMYRPEHVAAWKRIVDFVHARSNAKIGIQLAHAGRKGSTSRPWEGGAPLAAGGWELLAPSAIPFGPGSVVPREMTGADLSRVKAAFVQAARMAEEAGFDLVELHFAHGYLLSSFLSPLSNRRTDQYGGSLENRLRFPLELFTAVREAWPADRPISVRLSATDWVEGGFTGEDAVAVARALKAAGCDILDVSAGGTSPDAKPVYGRMFQTPFSDQIRNEAGIPTMTVGNITTHDQVNSILVAGRADLCVLARPHLADPHWTLHAAAEQGHDTQPWPVQYTAAKPRPGPR